MRERSFDGRARPFAPSEVLLQPFSRLEESREQSGEPEEGAGMAGGVFVAANGGAGAVAADVGARAADSAAFTGAEMIVGTVGDAGGAAGAGNLSVDVGGCAAVFFAGAGIAVADVGAAVSSAGAGNCPAVVGVVCAADSAASLCAARELFTPVLGLLNSLTVADVCQRVRHHLLPLFI